MSLLFLAELLITKDQTILNKIGMQRKQSWIHWRPVHLPLYICQLHHHKLRSCIDELLTGNRYISETYLTDLRWFTQVLQCCSKFPSEMTFISIFFRVPNQSLLTSLFFKHPGILPDSLFSEIKKNLLLILISNVQLNKT